MSATLDASQLQGEILWLVAKFLESIPGGNHAASTLLESAHDAQMLPRTLTYSGAERAVTLQEMMTALGSHSPVSLASLAQHWLNTHNFSSLFTAPAETCERLPRSMVEKLKLRQSTFDYHIPLSAALGKYEEIGLLFGHTYQVLCMQYDRTHHRLITGSDDWTIKIWCARTGWLLHTLRGHVGEVQILALNRESTMIASGATDGTIRIWCLRTGKPVAVLRTPQVRPHPELPNVRINRVTSVLWSPACWADARVLVAATRDDGLVRVWRWIRGTDPDGVPAIFPNQSTPLEFSVRNRDSDYPTCLSVDPAGLQIAVGATDGVVRLLSVRPLMERWLQSDDPSAAATMVDPFQQGLAVPPPPPPPPLPPLPLLVPVPSEGTSDDMDVDVVTEAPPAPTLPLLLPSDIPCVAHLLQRGSVLDVHFSNKGDRMLSAAENGCATIWAYRPESATWDAVELAIEPIGALDAGLDGNNNIDSGTGGSQSQSQKYSQTSRANGGSSAAAAAKPKRKRKHVSHVTMFCWLQGDEYVVTANADGYLRVYESATGLLVSTLRGDGREDLAGLAIDDPHEILTLEPHPTVPDVFLAATYLNGQVALWHRSQPKPVWSREIRGLICDARFAPDGWSLAVLDYNDELDPQGSAIAHIYGIGRDALMAPVEQFFASDLEGLDLASTEDIRLFNHPHPYYEEHPLYVRPRDRDAYPNQPPLEYRISLPAGLPPAALAESDAAVASTARALARNLVGIATDHLLGPTELLVHARSLGRRATPRRARRGPISVPVEPDPTPFMPLIDVDHSSDEDFVIPDETQEVEHDDEGAGHGEDDDEDGDDDGGHDDIHHYHGLESSTSAAASGSAGSSSRTSRRERQQRRADRESRRERTSGSAPRQQLQQQGQRQRRQRPESPGLTLEDLARLGIDTRTSRRSRSTRTTSASTARTAAPSSTRTTRTAAAASVIMTNRQRNLAADAAALPPPEDDPLLSSLPLDDSDDDFQVKSRASSRLGGSQNRQRQGDDDSRHLPIRRSRRGMWSTSLPVDGELDSSAATSAADVAVDEEEEDTETLPSRRRLRSRRQEVPAPAEQEPATTRRSLRRTRSSTAVVGDLSDDLDIESTGTGAGPAPQQNGHAATWLGADDDDAESQRDRGRGRRRRQIDSDDEEFVIDANFATSPDMPATRPVPRRQRRLSAGSEDADVAAAIASSLSASPVPPPPPQKRRRVRDVTPEPSSALTDAGSSSRDDFPSDFISSQDILLGAGSPTPVALSFEQPVVLSSNYNGIVPALSPMSVSGISELESSLPPVVELDDPRFLPESHPDIAPWLFSTRANAAQYYPQEGDSVLVFRDGYHRFLESIKADYNGTGQPNPYNNTRAPTAMNYNGEAVEGVVMKVEVFPRKLETGSMRVRLHVERTDSHKEIKVLYEETDSPDFVVLRDRVDHAVVTTARVGQGDEVDVVAAKNELWHGTVVAVDPTKHWDRFLVKWRPDASASADGSSTPDQADSVSSWEVVASGTSAATLVSQRPSSPTLTGPVYDTALQLFDELSRPGAALDQAGVLWADNRPVSPHIIAARLRNRFYRQTRELYADAIRLWSAAMAFQDERDQLRQFIVELDHTLKARSSETAAPTDAVLFSPPPSRPTITSPSRLMLRLPVSLPNDRQRRQRTNSYSQPMSPLQSGPGSEDDDAMAASGAAAANGGNGGSGTRDTGRAAKLRARASLAIAIASSSSSSPSRPTRLASAAGTSVSVELPARLREDPSDGRPPRRAAAAAALAAAQHVPPPPPPHLRTRRSQRTRRSAVGDLDYDDHVIEDSPVQRSRRSSSTESAAPLSARHGGWSRRPSLLSSLPTSSGASAVAASAAEDHFRYHHPSSESDIVPSEKPPRPIGPGRVIIMGDDDMELDDDDDDSFDEAARAPIDKEEEEKVKGDDYDGEDVSDDQDDDQVDSHGRRRQRSSSSNSRTARPQRVTQRRPQRTSPRSAAHRDPPAAPLLSPNRRSSLRTALSRSTGGHAGMPSAPDRASLAAPPPSSYRSTRPSRTRNPPPDYLHSDPLEEVSDSGDDGRPKRSAAAAAVAALQFAGSRPTRSSTRRPTNQSSDGDEDDDDEYGAPPRKRQRS